MIGRTVTATLCDDQTRIMFHTLRTLDLMDDQHLLVGMFDSEQEAMARAWEHWVRSDNRVTLEILEAYDDLPNILAVRRAWWEAITGKDGACWLIATGMADRVLLFDELRDSRNGPWE